MSPGVGDLDLGRVHALLEEDLDLAGGGVAGRSRVGHDRGAGADAGLGRGAVQLLDVLVDAGLVGGALDEGRLDLGALDPLLDVVDVEIGDLLGAATHQEHRQVVVGVDAGAGDDLQARLLGDPAHEGHVAPQEHRGRLDDRPHAQLARAASRFDRDVVVAARPDRIRLVLLGGSDVRPLDVDRVVPGAEVLVDQRDAELGGLDRPGHALHAGHRRGVYAALRRGGKAASSAAGRSRSGAPRRRARSGCRSMRRRPPSARGRRRRGS